MKLGEHVTVTGRGAGRYLGMDEDKRYCVLLNGQREFQRFPGRLVCVNGKPVETSKPATVVSSQTFRWGVWDLYKCLVEVHGRPPTVAEFETLFAKGEQPAARATAKAIGLELT